MSGVKRVRMETHAKHGEPQFMEVLPVGTRIRSRQFPGLTGYVHHHELHESGVLSPIPYRIEWDDNEEAHRVLGFLHIYATDGGVEPMESEATA